jgi:Pentapeptide repeats (8 copies)
MGDHTVSTDDVLTLLIAAAAVAVPLAAIVVGAQLDLRAARATLTELTLQVSRQTAKYDAAPADTMFDLCREIETLILQAEFVAHRLRPRWYRARALFQQSSVEVTLAMALDKVGDFWWADRHWDAAVKAADEHFKVVASSYWGAALCDRGELRQGRSVVRAALASLPSDDGNNCLVKANACLVIASWDRECAVQWLDDAGQEYLAIPDSERREAYAPGGIPALPLQNAYFCDANLTQARLVGAHLNNATLTRARLSGAHLTGADLTGADLTEADLTGADLAKADGAGEKFGGANLTDANLTRAVLRRADLAGANLTRANLTDANLIDANLTNANLAGAVLGPAAHVPEGWHRDEQTGVLEQVRRQPDSQPERSSVGIG